MIPPFLIGCFLFLSSLLADYLKLTDKSFYTCRIAGDTYKIKHVQILDRIPKIYTKATKPANDLNSAAGFVYYVG